MILHPHLGEGNPGQREPLVEERGQELGEKPMGDYDTLAKESGDDVHGPWKGSFSRKECPGWRTMHETGDHRKKKGSCALETHTSDHDDEFCSRSGGQSDHRARRMTETRVACGEQLD